MVHTSCCTHDLHIYAYTYRICVLYIHEYISIIMFSGENIPMGVFLLCTFSLSFMHIHNTKNNVKYKINQPRREGSCLSVTPSGHRRGLLYDDGERERSETDGRVGERGLNKIDGIVKSARRWWDKNKSAAFCGNGRAVPPWRVLPSCRLLLISISYFYTHFYLSKDNVYYLVRL